jgi:hypothetical protein
MDHRVHLAVSGKKGCSVQGFSFPDAAGGCTGAQSFAAEKRTQILSVSSFPSYESPCMRAGIVDFSQRAAVESSFE